MRDETGAPTVAAFVIRDPQGRVYPSRAKRLAPDFAFHPQVYRADGEKVRLPAGTYTVEYTRGPEYIKQRERTQHKSFTPDHVGTPSRSGFGLRTLAR